MEEFQKLLPQIMTGIFGFAAAILGYFIGRRTKVDDIRIKKKHELAEELSVLLQEDYRARKYLEGQYESSFGHLEGPGEAAHFFEKHQTLYASMRELIDQLPERRNKIVKANQRSAIYLSEKITSMINEYVGLTYFSFMTDGIGLVDTYAASFFEHLQDTEKSAKRDKPYTEIMRQFRKSL